MHARSLVALLAFTAACASSPAPRPPAPAPSDAVEPQAPAETADAPDASAELAERLAYLEAELAEARDTHHIPGLAVAIVRGDEVVFAKGFGVTDLDSQEPVTPETIFAIGSSTKAMTATLLAMLVDEGKLAWDDPVKKHLPELQLQVDAKDGAQPTVRDLLTHRTGFPRMNLLWLSGKLTRAEIFAYASKAEPTEPLREAWQYNNVQYMAAGEIAGRLAGSTWSELVRARLFAPLGMTSSHPNSSAADADPRRAKGYTWWAPAERFEPENHRILDVIGPAGSVYSNALEMSRWLRLLTGGGTFEGTRLVSEAALAETQRAQIEIDSGIHYGLGWMVRELDGHRLVEHTGVIDGYAAAVGVFPDRAIGYVLLTNASSHALQGMMPQLAYDAMIGARYRQTGSDIDLSIYQGRYEADMGPLSGKFLTVGSKGGTLTLDVPGQTVFELHPPNDEGKWVFKLTDDVAVSFVGAPDQPATALVLHQNGFAFELPREGATFPVMVDADAVAPLLGRYKPDDGGDQAATVELYRGRLTVVAPGPIRLQLDEPDEQGRWQVRTRPGAHVRFEVEDDAVKALIMEGDGKQRRLARQPDQAEPPTLARVLALRKPARRKRALERAGLIVARGTSRHPHAGLSGAVTLHFDGSQRFRLDADYGNAGRTTTVVTPEGGWEAGDFDRPQVLDGVKLAQARTMHPLALHGDWSDFFQEIKLAGAGEKDGRAFYRVELTATDLPAGVATVDAKTGDVIAYRGAIVVPIGQIPVAMRYEDFRKVGGVRIPFRIIAEEFQSGEIVLQLDRMRPRQRARKGLFPAELPAAPAAD